MYNVQGDYVQSEYAREKMNSIALGHIKKVAQTK